MVTYTADCTCHHPKNFQKNYNLKLVRGQITEHNARLLRLNPITSRSELQSRFFCENSTVLGPNSGEILCVVICPPDGTYNHPTIFEKN